MAHAENAMPAALNDASLPLVSIGIVTYNQKDFLRECIDPPWRRITPSGNRRGRRWLQRWHA